MSFISGEPLRLPVGCHLRNFVKHCCLTGRFDMFPFYIPEISCIVGSVNL